MELRFAVVEDRLPDAQRLESLLRLAFGGGQPLVCDHYESGDAFLAAFPSKNYQVVFLDICMEGTNGIETARILRRTDPDLLLVFVTSSPEYVWDAFPVHPFDYLLKPYREAHSLGVPVDWRLELPRQLAIPEADFCMMLGNLLENALHASQKLPPEQRQVKVLARMLSPAMLGLLVENRYDGVLKRQQGILHSTKHDGMGIGLVSIQTAVSRYGGSMTVETENGLFRVNILLNL